MKCLKFNEHIIRSQSGAVRIFPLIGFLILSVIAGFVTGGVVGGVVLQIRLVRMSEIEYLAYQLCRADPSCSQDLPPGFWVSFLLVVTALVFLTRRFWQKPTNVDLGKRADTFEAPTCCGIIFRDGSNFCTSCGRRIEQSAV